MIKSWALTRADFDRYELSLGAVAFVVVPRASLRWNQVSSELELVRDRRRVSLLGFVWSGPANMFGGNDKKLLGGGGGLIVVAGTQETGWNARL